MKYYFPELDNLGIRRQVNSWICKYVVILFIRQFSLNKSYTYQDFTSLPRFSDKIYELLQLKELLPTFEHYFLEITYNSELLEQLGYRELIKKESVYKFIEGLTNTIDLEINKLKKNTPLSKDKIKIFNDTTNKIVSNAFKE